MTIYSKLLKLGYTDTEIREAAQVRANTRQFTLAFAEQTGGDPLVGLAYSCDFRAEEEWGVRDIRKALGIDDYGVMGGKPKDRAHVSRIIGENTLIISKHELDPSVSVPESDEWDRLRQLKEFEPWYDGALPYAQGIGQKFRYTRMDFLRVAELKEYAAEMGISLKGLTRKADMLNKITTSDEYRNTATEPNTWPGWFHFGDILVLKADRGIVSDVVGMLYEAGRENGTLAMGGGLSNPFGSGLSLYDGDDISRATFKERKTYLKWYNKAMKPIPEVIARMESEDGIKPYFLGKPSTHKDGVTTYWLNHSTITLSDGRRKQAYGWFTLPELEAGEYKSGERYK